MKIEVRFFASLTEMTGTAAEQVEIDDGFDVEQLWMWLLERHPALRDVGFRPLAACDREYADWDRALSGVREVAFLPPVSGG